MERSHLRYGSAPLEVTGVTEDWNYVSQGSFGYTIELGGGSGTPTFQGPYQTHVVDQYLGSASAGTEGKGVREALLLAGEEAADPTDHETEPAQRGQATGLHPARIFEPGLLALTIDVAAPGHCLRIDDPRTVIGERPDRQIRRKRAIDHPETIRAPRRLTLLRRPGSLLIGSIGAAAEPDQPDAEGSSFG